MVQYVGRSAVLTCLVATLGAASALALADDKPSAIQERKDSRPGKSSGVIVKVESVEQGDQAGQRAWRVTVNTEVVWRDFVRDQAVDPSRAARTGTPTAAAKGQKTVAVEGHPSNPAMLATVNLDPRTEITMRSRSSTDEISDGAPTAEGASRVEDANDTSNSTKTAQSSARPGERRQALKARIVEPRELKPGLWIDVDYRRGEKENRARRVIVMRPVGGPDTAPEKEKPANTRQTNPGR